MKKCWILILVMLLLSGCGSQREYEQVLDVYAPQEAQAHTLQLTLPEDAAVMTLENSQTGRLYFCDGYTVTVQILDGGDLDATLQAMTGFSRDSLTVIQTKSNGCTQYECAWSCAGEGGDQVGRLLCLDDGVYHYVVTVMADAAASGALGQSWDELFASVSLEDIVS